MARANTELVKRISPSGIILIRDATVLVTAVVVSLSPTRKRLQSKSAPIGIKVILIYFTILFINLNSLESAVLMVWAELSSLPSSVLAPTAMASALQVPETIKEPETNSSPICFSMFSCSPVINDSFTSTEPSRTLLSTRI